MATFPKYPALPIESDKVRLICAGEPRLVLEDDRVTERRSPDGHRQWKVPAMLAVAGGQGPAASAYEHEGRHHLPVGEHYLRQAIKELVIAVTGDGELRIDEVWRPIYRQLGELGS